jgi:hypothetical protein
MITFFTTAKPFRGHDGIIQRNALKSWKLLHLDVEVILFGDDEGAAAVCEELGLVHHPQVERHESGAKKLDYIFRRANEAAKHMYLCYSNCDIVLTEDFSKAFAKTRKWRDRFVLVSQRWDMDITSPIDFGLEGWGRRLREATLERGFRQNEYWIDFFLFRKGLYVEIPPLIVGHCYWDNWMIWRALQEGVAIVDASRLMVPVHQNHGYSPQFGRVKGAGDDALSRLNLELIGGERHVRVIRSATHRLTRGGMVMVNSRLYTDPVVAFVQRARLFGFYRIWLPGWHLFLDVTRPMRIALGLRSKVFKRRAKNQS